jgi:hypothetical protein
VLHCPNCAAALTDQYCPACGQRRIEPRDLSARVFFGDLADQVGMLGFGFTTVRTLGALLIPGRLTTEFMAGRRQPYLSPIKVYFLCAALFFLAAPIAGFTLPALIADDRSGHLSELVQARAAAHGSDPAVFSQRFDLRLPSIYTLALGSGVLALAVMLQLLFRRGLPFGAHVVFALHFYAFLYLATAAAGSIRRFGLGDEAAAASAIAVMVPYVFVALKRAYRDSIPWTVLKSVVVIALTLALNFVADAVAIRLTLRLL